MKIEDTFGRGRLLLGLVQDGIEINNDGYVSLDFERIDILCNALQTLKKLRGIEIDSKNLRPQRK